MEGSSVLHDFRRRGANVQTGAHRMPHRDRARASRATRPDAACPAGRHDAGPFVRTFAIDPVEPYDAGLRGNAAPEPSAQLPDPRLPDRQLPNPQWPNQFPARYEETGIGFDRIVRRFRIRFRPSAQRRPGSNRGENDAATGHAGRFLDCHWPPGIRRVAGQPPAPSVGVPMQRTGEQHALRTLLLA
ncbi:hypothetical protein [Burkholderia sp. PU8-34]